MAVARDVAVEWIDRWDAQQEGYVPDREERFAVLADLVEHAVREVAEPVVVDLGCGPGSLAARIAERVPRALIVGVDADPLLVELARGRYGDLARWSVADLATDGWAATLPGPVHAAVSTTALHWMLPEQLAGLYRTVAAHTAPGGLLANGDHLAVADGLDGLAGAVAAGAGPPVRRDRAGGLDRLVGRAARRSPARRPDRRAGAGTVRGAGRGGRVRAPRRQQPALRRRPRPPPAGRRLQRCGRRLAAR